MDNFNVDDWGGYAKCYDVLNELIPYQRLQEEIINEVLFNKQQIILDSACGTGNFAYWANKVNGINGASIIGIDFSNEMLTRARQKCGKSYRELLKVNLNNHLPFESSSFHQIISTLTLYTIHNPKNFLLEMYRILKPGGILILSSPLRGYENGLILKEHCNDKGPKDKWLNIHQSPDYEKRIIKKVISDNNLAKRLIAIASHNRYIKHDYYFYFPQKDELMHLFFDCGFNILKSKLVYAKQDLLIVASKTKET